MADGDIDLREPVFFLRNRVWRCYTGGLLLDRFLGERRPADGHFPEEWIASTTLALNGPHQQSEDEGLSRAKLPDGSPGPLLRDLILREPEACLGPGATAEGGVGVLSKFLDSGVRLPIQCHPDRAFAREHYDSEHGKTEAWMILGTREVRGEEPYLLMGFKPGTGEDAFAEAVREQDVSAMESMLHRLPARPGDAFIISGRFPHAIGPGVFLLEIQEPTDWVVQPERFIGDSLREHRTRLSRSDMWGPLTPEVGLACFDYAGAGTVEAVEKRTRLEARTLSRKPASPEAAPTEAHRWSARSQQSEGASIECVIGPDVTDCFRVDRLRVPGELEYVPKAPFHVAIVTEGTGVVAGHPVGRGDAFFVSNQVESLRYQSARGVPDALLRDYRTDDNDVPLTVYVVSRGEGS